MVSETRNQKPAPDVSHSIVVPAVALAALVLAGCAPKARVAAPAPAAEEVGIASWYGLPHHGRVAASGEVYDMEQLTAAHRTLPFGTRVRVHNLTNGRNVDVRINDRGPFLKNRIIDLSRAAARSLAMLGPGTARVRLEILATSEESTIGSFAVQVGAFRDRGNAERLRGEMAKHYDSVSIVAREGDPVLWRVLVGRAQDIRDAAALARQIRTARGGTAADAFVIRLD